jgi:hypothetical protein
MRTVISHANIRECIDSTKGAIASKLTAEASEMVAVLHLRKEPSVTEVLGRLKGALVRIGRNVGLSPYTKLPLPPILINTMPKSASIYLTKTVAASLGVEYSLVSLVHGFFPTYFMMPAALESFSRGDVVRQEHFDPSPINLAICARYIDRIILHVRDPRQATLSWTHHLNRDYLNAPPYMHGTIHQPPTDFGSWSFQSQLDWHIDRHLPSLVAWLRQWVAVEATSPLKILWTRYEELVNDERGFLDRILAFYGIRGDGIDLRSPNKTIECHYRCGRSDEWKEVLTAEQKARSQAIIGRDILDHFGWSTD